jgi:anti-sigma-K factor RskA
MDKSHVIDDIPAYVLGAMDVEELNRIGKHISQCFTCRKELESYQVVVDNLPSVLPQHNPPAGLRTTILQNVSHSTEGTPPSVLARLRKLLNPFSTPVWGGVSLILIFFLGMSNLYFFQQTRVVKQPQSDFSVIQMVGQKSALAASGVIVMSGDGNFGTLVVDSLPVLESSSQYQLWLIKEGKRISGGVFSVQETGYGVLVVNSLQPLSIFDSFGVTVEPSGGSIGPTGEKVLAGNI